MKTRIAAAMLAVAMLTLVACGARSAISHAGRPAAPRAAAPMAFPRQYTGVVTDNLGAFDRACGCSPDLAVHYVRLGGAVDMTLPRMMLAAGAVPLLELEPYGIPLTAVTAGRDDRWLARYARAVASLHGPVLMSFAPEANGSWYSWGYRHSSPAAFVAAWRHVVTLFRRAGAGGARWAWIVNYTSDATGSLPALWPGSGYADMAGLDGYLVFRSQSFASLFGPTIQSVRKLTRDPVLITETAASPAAGKLRAVTELEAGVASYRLAGFAWFDISQHGALYHQDWSLEADPAALAAFRAATRPR